MTKQKQQRKIIEKKEKHPSKRIMCPLLVSSNKPAYGGLLKGNRVDVTSSERQTEENKE